MVRHARDSAAHWFCAVLQLKVRCEAERKRFGPVMEEVEGTQFFDVADERGVAAAPRGW